MNVWPRYWLHDRPRLVWLVAMIACWLTPLAGSLPRHASASPALPFADSSLTPSATQSAPSTATSSGSPRATVAPTFRLGNGAQPFGWSTAVGDFNTDGTADLVIADHTSRRAGVYAYQIQFSVSGLDAHNFAFESAQAAITVRVSDVDHDDDLDVVVNSAASREVVGIWLNDGHGRFRSAGSRRFASEVQRLTSLGLSAPSGDPFTGGARSPRTADGLFARVGTAPAAAPQLLTPTVDRLHRLFYAPSVAPRGPPLSA